MYATVVPVLLSAVALCAASPYYLPQQRQLFYPVVPQYQQQYQQQYQYSAPLAAPFNPYRQFFYPQASANLVAPVAAPPSLRYPGHVVAPTKQVLYYPQALSYPHNYVLAGDEAAEGSGGFAWPSWISNFSNYFVGEQPAAAQEGNSPAAGSEGAAPTGEKVEQPENNNEEPPKEDENKEDKETEEPKPEAETKVKAVPQKFVTLQQPQFFGNFGLQRINPAMVLPSANHGAVSSYLLLKNFPGVRFAPDVITQTEAEAELVPEGEAGKAALEYQKLLQQVMPERQHKEFSDDDSDSSITVDAMDAAITKDKPVAETDSEADKQNDEEETGPTVAQAKPKAIALAGPGGVAAAAPVGTALVGPGGMALSAPEATAVAGVKGASSGVVSPATTKQATKAIRTYQLANHNLSYLLKNGF